MNRTITLAVATLAVLGALAAPAPAQRHHGGGRGATPIAKPDHRHVTAGIHFGGRVVVKPAPRATRRWVPAEHRTITERVWVPERCEQVWVPPVFNECVDACGHRHRTIVREGYWKTVTYPGHWQLVTRTIEVPGHWEICAGNP